MQRSECELADFFENAAMGLHWVGFDGLILRANKAELDLLGYTAQEYVGHNIAEFHADGATIEDILRRLQAGEELRNYEARMRCKDGSIKYVLIDSNVRWEDGRFIHSRCFTRDFTAQKRADTALRESEERLILALEAGRMGTWEWNIRTNQVIWSPGLEAIHGLAPGTFPGTFAAYQEDIHPEDRERVLASIAQAVESGRDPHLEYRLIWRDGSIHWVESRGRVIRDESGVPARMIGVCIDVDERKRAEQTTRFLADASAALAELTDYESTLQRIASLAVPFFADWCAVDMQEADGSLRRLAVMHVDPSKLQLAHELQRLYPPLPTDARGIMKVLRSGEPDWEAEIPDSLLIESARDEQHLQIMRDLGLKSYICVPLRSRTRTLGVLTFVTAESGRIYDARDLRAAEDLAARAGIATENASLVEALKEADKRKDEFLAMLAHELRNPLTPLRNAVQILRVQGPPEPDLQWARDVIDQQVTQMTRLIDDLLDVSRITQGKIELRKERVPLAVVIDSALETGRPLIEKWGHELTVTMPPKPIHLEADVTRLAQVLLNLLDNAAKYTHPGGHIRLSAQREGEQVVIRVEDTGVGIPAEMLSGIFEMFTQVDRSLERSQGGLGIGLTLVQRLVEMHGGSAEAHSAGSGKGSEFIVRLPLAPAEVETEVPKKTAVHGEQVTAPFRRRILIVDDNREAADTLGMLLRVTGNEVGTAYDGLEAVEAAATFRPDVILLDIGLPGLNGYDTARRIRAERGPDVVLIALTGWGQEDDKRRSREAGFDYHLTKPVAFKTLQELLARSDPPRPEIRSSE